MRPKHMIGQYYSYAERQDHLGMIELVPLKMAVEKDIEKDLGKDLGKEVEKALGKDDLSLLQLVL